MMKNQLQIEGLRTYIFTYKSVFKKLSIEKLQQIFQLSNDEVVSILEKMITTGNVSGGEIIDNKFISFTSTTEPQRSKLQELAIVLNEKIQLLTEKNEKHNLMVMVKTTKQRSTKSTATKPTKTTTTTTKQQNQKQQQQQQSSQQQSNNILSEESANKFRYANVNSNNDEFQATA